jgi:hyperosmotically inducible protein
MWHARFALLVLTLCGVACAAATEPVGRVGISVDDARLVAAVRTAILNDRELGLRQIAVESRGGVVTLSGRVASDDEADRVVKLTRSVNGVRDVKSTLRVGA